MIEHNINMLWHLIEPLEQILPPVRGATNKCLIASCSENICDCLFKIKLSSFNYIGMHMTSKYVDSL